MLTGRLIDAPETERLGLISRVVATGKSLEAVHALSVGLNEGLRRRLFPSQLCGGELHEGICQFVAKRSNAPGWIRSP